MLCIDFLCIREIYFFILLFFLRRDFIYLFLLIYLKYCFLFAAGVVALMLEAGQFKLTPRHITHILVDTAYNLIDVDWEMNDAGYQVNHQVWWGGCVYVCDLCDSCDLSVAGMNE